jgi:hypothetical protein
MTNPLSTLTAPSNPTTGVTGSCSALVGNTYTCSPGNYSSLPGFQGGASIVFSPGTYVFTSAISIGNGSAVSFGSGTYWFQGGLSLGGGPSATFGTGTYIFGTSSSGTNNALSIAGGVSISASSSGVLFYAEGGTVNFAGGAGSTLVGLSQYDDVVIWDMGATGTTNPLQLTNGSTSSSISGGIYVPNGEIVISGSSPTTMVFVVTSTINQSNGTTLNVG